MRKKNRKKLGNRFMAEENLLALEGEGLNLAYVYTYCVLSSLPGPGMQRRMLEHTAFRVL